MAIEMNKELKAIYDEAITKAGEFVTACNDGANQKTRKELKKGAQAAMERYNDALANATYKAWAKEGDAVLTALRVYYIPDAKRVTFKVTDDNVTYLEVNEAKVKVNLPNMMNAIGPKHFHDHKWLRMSEKLAWLVASALNSKFDENPAFQYKIEDASAAFEFPEDVKPGTAKGINIALQQIFDSVIFIDDGKGKNKLKVYSNDNKECVQWVCIRESMTHQGKEPGTVAISSAGKMHELIGDCLHQMVTNGKFIATCD